MAGLCSCSALERATDEKVVTKAECCRFIYKRRRRRRSMTIKRQRQRQTQRQTSDERQSNLRQSFPAQCSQTSKRTATGVVGQSPKIPKWSTALPTCPGNTGATTSIYTFNSFPVQISKSEKLHLLCQLPCPDSHPLSMSRTREHWHGIGSVCC